MPSDLDKAVKASKAFERHLRDQHNATGRGLHELIDSAQPSLPREAIKHLRFVATIRNRLVHEDGYDRFDDPAEWKRRIAAAERALNIRRTPKLRIAFAILGLIAILAITASVVMGR